MFEASWVTRFLNYKALFVGLSGGLDSVVLLHVLSTYPQLHAKLRVIHVHHGLSLQADDWQNFCQSYCERLDIPFQAKQVNCRQPSNQEAAARAARYEAFDECVGESDALLLAHHQQDQAETLLLNLMRGTGIDGLCGMWQERERHDYTLFRPFLRLSREKIETYAHTHHLKWVEDESNQETTYTRNYIRHEILPRLQQRWPKVRENLANVTTHAQATERNLYDLACIDYPLLPLSPMELDFSVLQDPSLPQDPSLRAKRSNPVASPTLSPSRLANIVWFWLKQHRVAPLNQKMVQRVMNELVLRKNSGGLKISFLHHEVRSHQKKLYLRANTEGNSLSSGYSALSGGVGGSRGQAAGRGAREAGAGAIWTNFPSPFLLPDGLGYLVAEPSSEGVRVPANAHIEIRFRQGGEQFKWRQQTKSLKKLWQAWQVPAWKRGQTPLLYMNGVLAAVTDWAISDLFFAKGSDDCVQIKWIREHDK